MSLTICTGAWGPKAKTYLETFLPGAFRWPAEVNFVVYTDALPAGRVTKAGADTNVQIRSLNDLRGWEAFMLRHQGDPTKTGREQRPEHSWKPSAVAGGYNFRFDAVGFAGQAFAPEAAATTLPDGDVLCWLDADVVTHGQPPAGFIDKLVGDADGAYLGRGLKHSEIGFWAVRLCDRTRDFLHAFAEIYRSDRIFELGEWHSAYVWDETRRELARHGRGLNMKDLTPGGTGHVWHQSPLRLHLDHLKGERKRLGRSPERRR